MIPRPAVPPAKPPPPPAPPPLAPPKTLEDITKPLVDVLKDTVGGLGTAVQQIIDGLKETLGRIGKPPP